MGGEGIYKGWGGDRMGGEGIEMVERVYKGEGIKGVGRG